MLTQGLHQKQLQKLSPQQIQTIKMLSLPIIELERNIKNEIIENPALEESSNNEDKEYEEQEAPVKDENNEEFTIEDYIPDYENEEIPNYKLYSNNTSRDNDYKDIPYSSHNTLHDLLKSQIYMKDFSEKEKVIADFIIGNIDEAGYLTRETESLVDDIQFSQNIITSEEEIEKVIKEIQDFEPLGICARTPQECLLLQLNKKEATRINTLSKEIISNYFDLLLNKKYDKISEILDIDKEDIKSVIDEISKLNPKPGYSAEESSLIPYDAIIPDFNVFVDGENVEVSLNSRNIPDLRVSKQYIDMLSQSKKNNKRSDKEATVFIKNKIESAKLFIDSINQRQRTLTTTMNAIANYQYNFLISGDETKIRPMRLKDISDITDYDITTISRVIQSKYVSTPYGNFPLKFFFGNGLQTESGDEVSTLEIRNLIEEYINKEDKTKPLTDDKLKNMLESKGYPIARRTVSKYREQLKIPIARLRKEL